MGLIIGITPSIGGGSGGGSASIGDFILTEDGYRIATESNESLIQE